MKASKEIREQWLKGLKETYGEWPLSEVSKFGKIGEPEKHSRESENRSSNSEGELGNK